MSKVILVKGSGLGKTYVGKLLETGYNNQGIACKRHQADFQLAPEEIKTLNDFDGYVIIETNQTAVEGITPWQTIEITGGRQ